jgi:hypothetical protein
VIHCRQEQQHRRNNRNGYKAKRNIQGRSFQRFQFAERMEAFYGIVEKRANGRRLRKSRKAWPRISRVNTNKAKKYRK